jgi:hypothetical protein
MNHDANPMKNAVKEAQIGPETFKSSAQGCFTKKMHPMCELTHIESKKRPTLVVRPKPNS